MLANPPVRSIKVGTFSPNHFQSKNFADVLYGSPPKANSEIEFHSFSDCSLDLNANYLGHGTKPNRVIQSDFNDCRKYCSAREDPYFTYQTGNCYCKSSKAGRRMSSTNSISGAAKGCGGKKSYCMRPYQKQSWIIRHVEIRQPFHTLQFFHPSKSHPHCQNVICSYFLDREAEIVGTSSSSTSFGGVSSRLVDGKELDRNSGSNGCAQAGFSGTSEETEWFSLEFDVPQIVTRVQIARQLCEPHCVPLGQNVRITIGDSIGYNPNEPMCLPEIAELQSPKKDGTPGLVDYICTGDQPEGKYLKISRVGGLSICEAKVFGPGEHIDDKKQSRKCWKLGYLAQSANIWKKFFENNISSISSIKAQKLHLFSDCSLEININYYGHDIKPFPVKQPDVYACRTHCDSIGGPYFSYWTDKCYCKMSRVGRRRHSNSISGIAKGCAGK